MLRIRLTDDEDRKRLDVPDGVLLFDDSKLSNKEAILLQKATGLSPDTLSNALKAGSVEALTALILVALRRNGSTLGFDDIEFDLNGIAVDDLDAEEDPGKAPTDGSTGESG